MKAEIEWNSASRDYGTVKFGSDNDLVVVFYWKSVRNIKKSEDQKTPIFEDVEYVKIFRPGEQMNQIDRPIEENDKYRFARQWAQFQDKRAQMPEGTPIDLLFPNHPSIADRLKSVGVYTIQQCAGLTAHAIDNIGMGGQDYVNRAKAYMESAASGASVLKIQDELAKKEMEVNRLQMDNKSLTDQLNMVLARMKDLEARMGGIEVARMPVVNEATVDTQSERIKSKTVERRV